MTCKICGENIGASKSLKLFDKDICSLCIYSIGEIPTNHILYDFYKDKLRAVLKKKIHEVL